MYSAKATLLFICSNTDLAHGPLNKPLTHGGQMA